MEPLDSGYGGAARKHKNRAWQALFVQLMAAFEFAMKDFIAQALDTTDIYDDEIQRWKWLELNISGILGSRDGSGRLGAMLIHPLLGWQQPRNLNARYQNVFGRCPVKNTEAPALESLWIVRHSVAHNGGIVIGSDARRLKAPHLANEQILIDLDYLEQTTWFLRDIVQRLETDVGPALLERWFSESSSGAWDVDADVYVPLKLVTTFVKSRSKELPEITETAYTEDKERWG